jgi:hypothetical protein
MLRYIPEVMFLFLSYFHSYFMLFFFFLFSSLFLSFLFSFIYLFIEVLVPSHVPSLLLDLCAHWSARELHHKSGMAFPGISTFLLTIQPLTYGLLNACFLLQPEYYSVPVSALGQCLPFQTKGCAFIRVPFSHLCIKVKIDFQSCEIQR